MQRIGVLPFLRNDIPNNPNGILPDILILGVQSSNDSLHRWLILNDGRDGLIFLIAGEFP